MSRNSPPDQSGEAGRPAFYALAPGGWRDYWTLLHPPYTIWHLSYVAIGAATAPHLRVRWLVETLVAFLFAMGIAAHALDELHGRPLRTRIPRGVLIGMAVIGLAAAIGLGIDGMVQVSGWLAVFIVIGAALVVAYTLELLGGAFHSDLWFAIAWGAFPVLTAAFAQTAQVRIEAFVAAGACALISAAQRTLSTPVRQLRRRVRAVRGELELVDGGVEPIDAATLRLPAERALRLLSLAMPLLAAALVTARLLD
jgi:hypothetical protein